jgi:hypothetical protein
MRKHLRSPLVGSADRGLRPDDDGAISRQRIRPELGDPDFALPHGLDLERAGGERLQ